MNENNLINLMVKITERPFGARSRIWILCPTLSFALYSPVQVRSTKALSYPDW